VWEGFPSARFLLPAIELEGGEGGSLLTLRDLVPAGADLHGRRRALTARLYALAGELARSECACDQTEAPERAQAAPLTLAPADPRPWALAVQRILAEEVARGRVSKVVLARAQPLRTRDPLDPAEVALRLWRASPGSHLFFFQPEAGGALVGAAPETVATVRGGRLRATAVAGSRGAGASPEERRALGEALLASAKDRREHGLCVEDMLARLAPLARALRADAEPHLLSLPAIQHLETVVEADLLPGTGVLEALEALHPTPAVCGFPREGALAVLEAEEPFRRGWYAGPVGWFDREGDGVFAPALRSAVVRGSEWLLFAGAGIVEGSDPGREWEETLIKLRPMLEALGGEER
jgi:isochorismate synthase